MGAHAPHGLRKNYVHIPEKRFARGFWQSEGRRGEAKLDIKEELELECKGWGKEWGSAKPSVVDGV